MKNYITTLLLVASLVLASCASVNTAHTPPDGSAERNAILQAVHHGITVINSGAYLLVLGLTYGRAHYKCARFIENYAIVICIQFLPSAKNLACCQQNLGWEDRKATLALEQKYVLFRGTG